ncbi:MAG: site-specific integrase [Betaproteobacteria bacterium]|nr:site-specific integrase [Betaproteobacteria bacterium]
MASFQKRAGAWRALIRRKGYPAISNTFDTKAEAEAWARKTESDIDRGQHVDHRPAKAVSFADCLKRYQVEVSAHKKGAQPERYRIAYLLEQPFAMRAVGELRGDDFARYRNARLKEVSPSSVRLELALISHMFSTAIREWGLGLSVNPIRQIAKPKVQNARDRRFVGDEETRLFTAIDAICTNKTPRALRAAVHPSLWFRQLVTVALETGMRQGELLSMTWDNLHPAERYVLLPDTKNGTSRSVPLPRVALNAITATEKHGEDPRIFPVSAFTVKNYWERAIEIAVIQDLHFHDLRHEATSRMARKLPMHDLMKVTGHKTATMLARYYHPVPADLAVALDA